MNIVKKYITLHQGEYLYVTLSTALSIAFLSASLKTKLSNAHGLEVG